MAYPFKIYTMILSAGLQSVTVGNVNQTGGHTSPHIIISAKCYIVAVTVDLISYKDGIPHKVLFVAYLGSNLA